MTEYLWRRWRNLSLSGKGLATVFVPVTSVLVMATPFTALQRSREAAEEAAARPININETVDAVFAAQYTRAIEALPPVLARLHEQLPDDSLHASSLARRPNVTLLHASDGAQGLVLLSSHRPDLVLLDLHLPQISGEEVLRRIWGDPETRTTPVVVVTADATPTLLKRLKMLGAADLLTKPLEMTQVLHVVDTFLTDQGKAHAHG